MNALPRLIHYPFQPLAQTVRDYDRRTFRRDAVAGLTVAVLDVPQAMAYAIIAGVPPQYGLFTSIIQGLTGPLFSSNRHLVTGPTNTMALLAAAVVTRAMQQITGGEADPALYLQLVITLTLIKGLIQLLFAAARMGTLVRYVSHSVIVGFAAGAGVLIAVNQVHNFLGLPASSAPLRMPGVPGELQRLWPHITEVNPRALLIGVLSLAVMLGLRWVWRFLPGPLLAVVISALLVYTAGWGVQDLTLVGELPRGLPSFTLPSVGLPYGELLFAGALAMALVSMIETVAIGKTLAARSGTRVDANREFFSLGVMNLIGAFFQNIPGTGSFTRSALGISAGGRTCFTGVFAACFVALIFLIFSPMARYIPLASLAAILFVVAYSLIDWRYILRVMRTSRSDTSVCLITFLATLVAPLEYAIYIGVFLNLALYLRHASQLHMNEMVHTDAGPFMERPIQDRAGERKIIFLQLEGDLFFGVADELQDRLTEIGNSGVKVMILRLKRTHSLDATVLHVFDRFARDFQQRGGHMVLCGVKPELIATFRSFGLIRLIGEDNVFETGPGVFTSAKRAIERARELVGGSIDAEHLSEIANETETWTYQI